MNEPATQDPHAILRKFQLTLEGVHAHVINPPHLRDSEVRIDTPAVRYRLRSRFSELFSFLFRLNTEKLGNALHDLLSPCLMGYALELRSGGVTVLNQQWHWSKAYIDGLRGWDIDTPMHVASVSKLVTAMAMTRLLHVHGMSYDDRIEPWLPQYWQRGGNIQALTFRHLLTHTSGLLSPIKNPGPIDFQSMKDAIALGSTDLSTRDYKNINYSLCRVLLATVNGDTYPSMLATPTSDPFLAPLFGVRDSVWDTVSIRAYTQYVNDNIFSPAGLAARDFNHLGAAALAYGPIPDSNPGWNSGDKQSGSGAIGWHLTVRELLRVMAAYRRSGKIVTPTRAQSMLENDVGIDHDFTRATRLGTLYAKGGWWQSNEGKVEQSNAFFLPGRMELVVLANSPSCMPDTAFMGKVSNAIDASIEPRILSLVTMLRP
jgi:CubicO group peptidase (beta-lactamase class C family)